MFRLSLLTLALLSGQAAAQAPEESSEPTGYRDVELVEGGPTKMEDKRDYKNLVIAGPMFLPGGLHVKYQRLITDSFSASLGGGYAGKKNWLNTETDMTRTSLRLGADIHPVGNGMHGWFIGPRLVHKTWGFTTVDTTLSSSSLQAGTVAGWRWIADPGLSCGLGLGMGYGLNTSSIDSDLEEIEIPEFQSEGTRFLFEFTLGWAF